jgi:hypothetical protein
MNRSWIFGVAVASLACTVGASAYPSLAGPTGTGSLPTASVVAPGQLQAAIDLYEANEWHSDTAVPIRAVYGIAPNVEVGAGYTNQQIADDDGNSWNINAKLKAGVTQGDITWAVGGRYGQTDVTAFDTTQSAAQLYVVASKDFVMSHSSVPTIRGSLGLNYTSLDTDTPDGAFSDSALRPFISASATFANRVNVSLDFQAKDHNLDIHPMHAIMVRYPFTNAVAGEIGLTNMQANGVSGGESNNVVAGLNMTFSSRR